MEYLVESINPEKAKAYLSMSKGNRKLAPAVVKMFARDMASGNWKCTHQAIAFDENGVLIDGHHRLSAVIKAGVNVNMLVARNVPHDTIEYVDTGRCRSLRDTLYYVDGFESPALRNSNTLATLKLAVQYGYKSDWQLSNAERMAFLEHFKKEFEMLYSASISRHDPSMTAPIRAGLFAGLLCGEKYEDIYNFCSVWSNSDTRGCEDRNYTVILNLRRQLDNAKLKRMKIARDKQYSMAQNALWNFINNTPVRTVKETETPRYPIAPILDEFFNGHQEQY